LVHAKTRRREEDALPAKRLCLFGAAIRAVVKKIGPIGPKPLLRAFA